MKNIQKIEFHCGTKEELFSSITDSFPYMSSCAELDKFPNRCVPWHWHKEVEVFIVESGSLIYYTSDGEYIFPKGSGGFINSNALHMTKVIDNKNATIQFLHLFDSSVISDKKGGKIETEYVNPLINFKQIKIIPLYPDNDNHKDLLNLISKSFDIHESDFAYELKLRNSLSEIWYHLFEISKPIRNIQIDNNSDKMRLMMIYIHEHYHEKIKTINIASSAFVSERVCFRVFKECIHMSPLEYLNSYRIQRACAMLMNTSKPVTMIGYECGLGTSSHFSDLFKKEFGCTPLQYRYKWQKYNF